MKKHPLWTWKEWTEGGPCECLKILAHPYTELPHPNMPSSTSASKRWKSKNVTADCPRIPFAPGLEATQGRNGPPMNYAPVSFGSKREYEDDSEGWTTVTKGKKRGGRRKTYVQSEYYMY